MPTSKTTAKKPSDHQPKKKAAAKGTSSAGVTSASSWKKRDTTELELPSGNVCLVRRPGMDKLLASGTLPDNLTKIAMEGIDAAQTPGKKQSESIDTELMSDFLREENALQDLITSFDKVTALVVVEPPVVWHMREAIDSEGNVVEDDKHRPVLEEIPLSERDPDILYTDDVDMDDKTFLFNFVVGGSRDLERFRKEFGDAMADLADVPGLPVSAE